MEVNANKSTHFLPLHKIPSTFVQLAKRERERDTSFNTERERKKERKTKTKNKCNLKSVVESPLSGQ